MTEKFSKAERSIHTSNNKGKKNCKVCLSDINVYAKHFQTDNTIRQCHSNTKRKHITYSPEIITSDWKIKSNWQVIPQHESLKDIFCWHGGTLLLRRYWRKLGWTSLLHQAIVWFQNFPFLSKVLKRIVNRQLIGYLNNFHLFPDAQSAYRWCHSTETAVLKVFWDIVDAIANSKIAPLSVLDLTVAFDTVDHDILLRWLEVTYGFNGAGLQWLWSYVEDQMQSVHLNSSISRLRRVICGVSQESVLGLLLFVLYTADIGLIVQAFRLKHHNYTDDNQIYSSCFLA